MIANIRLYLYAASALCVIGAVWYVKYTWYDAIVKKVEQLEEQLDVTGAELNRCYINGRKNSVESFIEGVGNVDENISIDLDSLHT